MNPKARLFCVLAFSVIAVDAWAEGGTCPQGYYPVNSPGLQGCAPMSGSGGAVRSPPDPGPQWETRWMSVVYGENGFGAVIDMPSKRKAESDALAQCREMGGTGCHVKMTTYNQCIAVARGGDVAPIVRAPDKTTAESFAIDDCRKARKNARCEIYYSACSYPVRVR